MPTDIILSDISIDGKRHPCEDLCNIYDNRLTNFRYLPRPHPGNSHARRYNRPHHNLITLAKHMTTGIVFDIKKFSIHDGPGIRTTVFLKGCGLRCWWCHNPESQRPTPELMLRPDLCIRCGACVTVCPQAAVVPDGGGFITDRARCTQCGTCATVCYADAREMVGQEMTVDAVMAEILRDSVFYEDSGGGVTFSGGEPLLQGDFLLALLKACKAHGLHTAIDTCGHAPTETLHRIRSYVDLFLYDLKLMDDTRHREVTGVSNQRILENLRMLDSHGHKIILRIPLIPRINDDVYNIYQMAQLARGLSSLERIDLLPYHKIGQDKYARIGRINPMPKTEPLTETQVNAVAQQLRDCGLNVNIGG